MPIRTATAAKVCKQVKFPVEWPTSKVLMDAGFRDSYREIHPDPVKKPGFTWTAGYPYPCMMPGEIFDRIDFIWTKGKSTTINSQLVGEGGKHVVGGQHINKDVAIPVMRWPSDHRAVVSEFQVQPASAPVMLSIENRLVNCGENIRLHFHLDRKNDLKLVILPADGDPKKDLITHTDIHEWLDRKVFTLSTLNCKPGAYKAALIDKDGKDQAKVNFWVKAKDSSTELSLEKQIFDCHEPIRIGWRNAPGNKWDWIAICKGRNADITDHIAHCNLDGRIEGSFTFSKESLNNQTLEPGDYEARLFSDGSYVLLDTLKFTIKADKAK